MIPIEQLNAEHAIPGQLKFVAGKGGFPLIKIANDKAKALISVYAGQVLSFQPLDQADDLLFLSNQAYYQAGKAIKGGVPICWPWFGPDPEGQGRASHGFVRNRPWSVASTEATVSGETKVTLSLADTDESRQIWPYSFGLQLQILVGQQLSLRLQTQNRGDQPFSITQALHTYFRIGDIHQVKVLGLKGADYLDKVDGGVVKKQPGEVIIDREVDRIYTSVKNRLIIEDAALQRNIHIHATGSNTVVVWNPWAEISANMADLEDDDYQRMICVETANAADEVVTVAPEETYDLMASYSVVSA